MRGRQNPENAVRMTLVKRIWRELNRKGKYDAHGSL